MPSARARATKAVRLLADAFEENDLLTYASAIAFQLLIAVIALGLLGLSLLHFLGEQRVWADHLRPFVHARFSFETVFTATDSPGAGTLRSPRPARASVNRQSRSTPRISSPAQPPDSTRR